MQSFHVENAGIKDMLQDIAIEEFDHLEMVGKMIEAHTKIDARKQSKCSVCLCFLEITVLAASHNAFVASSGFTKKLDR